MSTLLGRPWTPYPERPNKTLILLFFPRLNFSRVQSFFLRVHLSSNLSPLSIRPPISSLLRRFPPAMGPRKKRATREPERPASEQLLSDLERLGLRNPMTVAPHPPPSSSDRPPAKRARSTGIRIVEGGASQPPPTREAPAKGKGKGKGKRKAPATATEDLSASPPPSSPPRAAQTSSTPHSARGDRSAHPSSRTLPTDVAERIDPRFVDEGCDRFYIDARSRTISTGSVIRFSSCTTLSSVRHHFLEQPWEPFLQLRCPTYDLFVRCFYANLRKPAESGDIFPLETYFLERRLVITEDLMCTLLGAPSEGEIIGPYTLATFPHYAEGETPETASAFIHRSADPRLIASISYSDLRFYAQVIAKIIQFSIIPKHGGRSHLSGCFKLAVYCVLKNIKINLPQLIGYNMRHYWETARKLLPYGRLLTLIARHFELDLTSLISRRGDPDVTQGNLIQMGYPATLLHQPLSFDYVAPPRRQRRAAAARAAADDEGDESEAAEPSYSSLGARRGPLFDTGASSSVPQTPIGPSTSTQAPPPPPPGPLPPDVVAFACTRPPPVFHFGPDDRSLPFSHRLLAHFAQDIYYNALNDRIADSNARAVETYRMFLSTLSATRAARVPFPHMQTFVRVPPPSDDLARYYVELTRSGPQPRPSGSTSFPPPSPPAGPGPAPHDLGAASQPPPQPQTAPVSDLPSHTEPAPIVKDVPEDSSSDSESTESSSQDAEGAAESSSESESSESSFHDAEPVLSSAEASPAVREAHEDSDDPEYIPGDDDFEDYEFSGVDRGIPDEPSSSHATSFQYHRRPRTAHSAPSAPASPPPVSQDLPPTSVETAAPDDSRPRPSTDVFYRTRFRSYPILPHPPSDPYHPLAIVPLMAIPLSVIPPDSDHDSSSSGCTIVF